jgi:hypothetical protein
MFWAWIFVLLRLVSFLIWKWCTIHDIFMLCVMSVVIVMVIGANIELHNMVVMIYMTKNNHDDVTQSNNDKIYIHDLAF